MTKLIAVAVLGLFLLPSAAFAQYHEDPKINSLVSLLMEQVKSLQAQLTALEKKEDTRIRTEKAPEPTYEELVAYRNRLSNERLLALDAIKESNCEKRYSPGTVAFSAQQKRCGPLRETVSNATKDLILVNKKLEVLTPFSWEQ